jgi:predicted DCC family thiol-disulfide oxidoreductase YuxK
MCNGVVRFILERDPAGRFHFAPLQSDLARQVLRRHGRNASDLDTMYLVANYERTPERVFERSAAVVEVWRRLGGPWKLLGWLRFVPAPLRDFVYGLIVKSRYRIWGKYESCPLPAPEWRGRFVQ